MVFTAESHPGFRQDELDLLNAFQTNISDTDLQELRQLIRNFLASRLGQDIGKVDDNNWTVKDAEQFLNIKMQATGRNL